MKRTFGGDSTPTAGLQPCDLLMGFEILPITGVDDLERRFTESDRRQEPVRGDPCFAQAADETVRFLSPPAGYLWCMTTVSCIQYRQSYYARSGQGSQWENYEK
jgi:hypothetical protein